MACVIIPAQWMTTQRRHNWRVKKKREGNAEKKEYAEFKQEVQQPKTGNFVRFIELEMGERSDLDQIWMLLTSKNS